MEPQKIPNNQIIFFFLKKKHKALSIKPLDFKVYYKATIIKMHGFGIKSDNRPMAQNEESRIKLPLVYMVNWYLAREPRTPNGERIVN